MTNQEVLSELKALKSDLNLFTDQMVRLRYEDLKSVFLEQMRLAMRDEGKRSFLDDANILSNNSECDLKGECLQKEGRKGRENTGKRQEMSPST